MNIEIITTRNDKLKETGFGILKSCFSVFDSIRRMKHVVRLSVCTTKNDLNDVLSRKPDLVILAVKYISVEGEEDIWLTDFFDYHKINYSGSIREVLRFDSDKVLAKTHLKKFHINSANYFTALPGEYHREGKLPIAFPLFLKPMDAANGNGVDDFSFVNNFDEYENKVKSLFDTYKQPVLAEEYLDGKEYTVSIIKTKGKKFIVSAIEIVPPISSNGIRILGSMTKTANSEVVKKISNIDLSKKVKNIAIRSFIKLGGRDFGRVDIKTNLQGDCFFMEANLVPGMTEVTSYFPRACEVDNGLVYDDVIKLMIQQGLDRVAS